MGSESYGRWINWLNSNFRYWLMLVVIYVIFQFVLQMISDLENKLLLAGFSDPSAVKPSGVSLFLLPSYIDHSYSFSSFIHFLPIFVCVTHEQKHRMVSWISIWNFHPPYYVICITNNAILIMILLFLRAFLVSLVFIILPFISFQRTLVIIFEQVFAS